ncbi:MAG: histidine--tRNA ligase [Ruminococcus sp.]|nr:histidine--tRNA ligase [Ruminococcus sp.]
MSQVSIKRPKGTQDMIPSAAYKWHTVENICKDAAKSFGYKEIRTPTFEDTGLFVRSVGDTTDVVQKEMYTVSSSGEAQFTLKPEGTAGAMRAVIENGLLNEGIPQKVYYLTSCFRHEKPQAGRLREFHQFGCEMLGASGPAADADMILLAKTILDNAGVRNTELFINSIGCPECRAKYTQALKEYFSAYTDELCGTCLSRLERNPMRILDCKSPVCSEIAKGAPEILDYLCDDCKEHFTGLQKILAELDIEFTINPRIVRGLDYYTKTVFEFVTTDIGAQGTICGGGRYDGLVGELGGADTPALGFAIGLERLILTMENQGSEFIEEPTCDIYLASIGDAALVKTASLARDLRNCGFNAEYDLVGRSLKAQMKYADKIHAKFSIVIGDDDLKNGYAKLKNMETGEKEELRLSERFSEHFSDILVAYMFGDSFYENQD